MVGPRRTLHVPRASLMHQELIRLNRFISDTCKIYSLGHSETSAPLRAGLYIRLVDPDRI